MMPAPRFDPTISLGSLVTAGTILVTVAGAWVNVSTRLDRLERDGTDRESRLRTVELSVATLGPSIGAIREAIGEMRGDIRRLVDEGSK